MKTADKLEWMTKLAKMERGDLIDAYEKEGELRHQLALQVNKLEQAVQRLTTENGKLKNIREKHMVFICRSTQHGVFAARRMALNPNRVTLVRTDDIQSMDQIRGMQLDPSTVFFVRGWKGGKYASELPRSIVPSLRRADGTPVGMDCIPYAPDPHFDMHEDDDWQHATVGLRMKRGEL